VRFIAHRCSGRTVVDRARADDGQVARGTSRDEQRTEGFARDIIVATSSAAEQATDLRLGQLRYGVAEHLARPRAGPIAGACSVGAEAGPPTSPTPAWRMPVRRPSSRGAGAACRSTSRLMDFLGSRRWRIWGRVDVLNGGGEVVTHSSVLPSTGPVPRTTADLGAARDVRSIVTHAEVRG